MEGESTKIEKLEECEINWDNYLGGSSSMWVRLIRLVGRRGGKRRIKSDNASANEVRKYFKSNKNYSTISYTFPFFFAGATRKLKHTISWKFLPWLPISELFWATSQVIKHHTRLEFPHPIQCNANCEPRTVRMWNVSSPQKHSANDLHASGDGDPIGTDPKPSFWSKNELVQSNRNHLAKSKRSWESVQYNLHAQILKLELKLRRECGSSRRSGIEGLRLSINCSKRSKNRTATMANCCNFLAARSSKRRTTAELLSDWMNGLNEWRPKPFRLASLSGAWVPQWSVEKKKDAKTTLVLW